jgi:hypothetical protein
MKFAGEHSVFAATQRYLFFSYFITEIISRVSKGSPYITSSGVRVNDQTSFTLHIRSRSAPYITPSGVRVNDQASFTLHIRSRSAQDKLTINDLFGIVTMKGIQHWVFFILL